jgi:hypothetical protein
MTIVKGGGDDRHPHLAQICGILSGIIELTDEINVLLTNHADR